MDQCLQDLDPRSMHVILQILHIWSRRHVALMVMVWGITERKEFGNNKSRSMGLTKITWPKYKVLG
jgi:hypothetical protein